MSNRRSIIPLISGIVLVALGGLFLAVNVYRVELDWLRIAKYAIALLLLGIGALKLTRHFLWDEARVRSRPSAASLLGGIFWGSVGLVGLLHLLDVVRFPSFFGSYWPAVLILFGIGKIIDFYRFSGRLQFRSTEVIGVVFVILAGWAVGYLATFESSIRSWADMPHRFPIRIRHDARPKVRVESRKEVAAAGVRMLQVHNSQGDVEIASGAEDKIEVELTTAVETRSEAQADQLARQVALTVAPEGDGLRVGTNREEFEDGDHRLSTHLRLKLPPQLPVSVSNRNGAVRIEQRKADVAVENSYGSVTVESVTGSVTAKNRYESIALRDISGDVRAENKRGRIHLKDIKGTVAAATDYETISADNIAGKADFNNHFGQVRAKNIQGPTSVNSPGSEVYIEDIAKTLFVENSHRRVKVSNVAETFELNTSYSKVSVSQVAGPVTIRASHSEVDLERVKNGASVQGSGAQVTLSEVEGPVKVATSLRRVALNKFQGPADIQNEYGDIVMAPDAPLKGSLVAINRNAEITLELPEKASVRVSAQAPGGEVISEVGSRRPAEKSQMFEETIEGGKNDVRLQTTYSRIRITRSE